MQYITSRATNRSFRFVPNKKVRKAIHFALAVVSERYRKANRLLLHEFVFMSNHYHLLLTDVAGCYPKFIGELNMLISRELNSIRGISGTNFEGYDQQQIADDERLIDHSVYTGANPVAAFLVATAREWPGVSSVGMRYGKAHVVKKPKLGMWAGKDAHKDRAASRRSGRAAYAGRSRLPETAELELVRPKVRLDLSDTELRDLILQRLADREEELAVQRAREKIVVKGRQAVVQAHYLSMPRTEEMFGRTPTVSASSSKDRVTLLEIRKAFIEAYRAARIAFCAGVRDVLFPRGTWQMRFRSGVHCEPCPG